MIETWKDPVKVELLKSLVAKNMSARDIAKQMKLTRDQVIGYCWRNSIPIKGSKAARETNPVKKNVMENGSRGVIERIISDKSRITLKNIPSIEEWQASTAYSYTVRDRTSDT